MDEERRMTDGGARRGWSRRLVLGLIPGAWAAASPLAAAAPRPPDGDPDAPAVFEEDVFETGAFETSVFEMERPVD
jgi:hypothetical protein